MNSNLPLFINYNSTFHRILLAYGNKDYIANKW